MMPLILTMFVIVGLLSTGMMLLASSTQRAKTVEAIKSLDSTANAVVLWSASSRTLPPTLQTVFTGGNPLDPWGNTVVYIFDNNLTAIATGGICGRRSTSLTVNGTPNTAFALLSTAGDAFQSIWTGTPAFSTAVFTYPATVPGTTATLATGDLFRIITLEELKNRAGCYGSTQGRLKILNNELPKGCNGTPYSATIFAGGGVPPYPTYTITGLAGTGLSALGANITGTPTTTGSFPVSVQVTDSHTPAATTVQKNLTLTVNSCGAPPPTPAAAWAMNEGTGNTIGSGSTLGTISGTANWVARGGGYALLLNGTNNYIYFNDINYFNIGTGNVTLSAWVNFSGTPAQHWCDSATGTDMAIGAIAGKGFLYPAIGYGMYVTQTRPCPSCTSCSGAWSNYKVAFQLRNPANTDIHSVYSDVVIAGGSWAHLVAVLDRSASPATDQIKLYINGIKQTDASNDYQYTSSTALNFDNTFKFTIGARHDGGSGYGFPYWGYIDDVQLYKVALTDAQISILYTSGLTP